MKIYLCMKFNMMSEITQSPVLAYVVEVLKNAIIDAKVEIVSAYESAVIDGSDAIRLKEELDTNGDTAAIWITDKKEILYSEDLLETVYNIHKGAGNDATLKRALLAANMIVNGLNVEAELMFHAVRDQFYSLGSSYEFVKFLERADQQFKFNMTFGDHKFVLKVLNEPAEINIEAEFDDSVAPVIRETILKDLNYVKEEINAEFK